MATAKISQIPSAVQSNLGGASLLESVDSGGNSVSVTYTQLAVALGQIGFNGTVNTNTLIVNGGGHTGADAHYTINISDTFNTSGELGLIYGNVVNTASGSGSNFVKFQVGGSTVFQILLSGEVVAFNTVIAPLLAIEQAAGTNRELVFITGTLTDPPTSGSFRWKVYTNATAESGSNAGSDFSIDSYSDSSTLIGHAILITRASLLVAIAGALSVTGGFGCNGAGPQTPVASEGALAAYGAGSNGFDTSGHASSLYALVVAMRATLVANGMMS